MIVTLPVEGKFNFKCIHCDRESPKKPIAFKNNGQDFSLVECPCCHKATLVRFSDDVATLFKVTY